MTAIADDVLAVLSASECDGDWLKLPGQLDRALYLRVAKVIEALGGAWNRKRGAHVFTGDAREAIEPALLTGEYVDAKREFDDFPTPADLAARLIRAAEIEPSHLVLEPSAGGGALLSLIAAITPHVVAVELRRDAALALRARGADVVNDDFLAVSPVFRVPGNSIVGRFDRICMNPPFSRGADARHILHAMDFLKAGGRLVAIASAGVTFRADAPYPALRKTLAAWDAAVEPLPAGSFKESGTLVNTVLIVGDKPEEENADA